jgi:predicted metal-dependent peptidase
MLTENDARNLFIAECINPKNRWYQTLAIFKQVVFKFDDSIPTAAMVYTNPPQLLVGSKFQNEDDIVCVILHELQHLVKHINYDKTLNHELANIAMDIEIHESLRKLLPHKTEMINQYSVREKLLPEALPDQNWIYYYNQLLQSPNVQYVQFDEHDDNGTLSKEDVEKIIEKSVVDAKILENKIGNKSGDFEIYGNVVTIPEHIKQLIRKIKIKTKRIKETFIPNTYTYQRENNAETYLPGKIYKTEMTLQCVMLIDLSGSMFNADTVNIMHSVLSNMQKKELVDGIYTFDTELRLYDGKYVGGGGTVINQEMLDAIKKTHGKNVEIVLLSDMEICWECDRRSVKIHKVEI